tara:strand:+ start:1571 stop:3322 length:1752 start_codon:yes stop_codon:yes gene_type:complete
MAEKIVSPGVFTNEIDASFLPAAIGDIGAAIIGPCVKGPVEVPTVVTSYAEFQERFGDTFKSGSNYYTYFTSIAAKNYLQHSGQLTVVRVAGSNYSPASASVQTGSSAAAGNAFQLYTLSDGAVLNNSGTIGTNNLLANGTKNNIKWEISTKNNKKGTFTLVVRRGDDNEKRKNPLETWKDLSLDPNSANYISKRIGDQYMSFKSDDGYYLQPTGDYPNKSKYVRVSNVLDIVDYLDENGNVRGDGSISSSLPALGSGSLGGAFGGGSDGEVVASPHNFYGQASASDNWQGLDLTAASKTGSDSFVNALNLLSNDDEYDINMILMPGVANDIASHLVSKAIDTAEARGDTFTLADPVVKGSMIADAVSAAETYDSNYTAMYWPWVQVNEPQIGRNVWVPPSAVMAGVIAFNDKVAHEWFAPAGLNRGGIDTAIQAERKLTHGNRDTLYDANVNPLATFPGEGVCAWGQKTLQKKSSALDRVNVRRLLIKVKKFIAASSRFLVFEQNNASTRTRFLNIANPFLERVQQQSGLTAFKVVMDDTNNTPDLVDRNILYGQIFLQPTRTAEFIVLDFTVMPTGAAFPE